MVIYTYVIKTTKQFIKEATVKHDGKYSYVKTEYSGVMNPVIIVCPIHGEFNVTPNAHLSSKQGCQKCSKKYRPSTEEFIHDVNIIHSNKYSYSKTVYGTNNTEKVTVACHIHGDFLITPANHRTGYGCPECGNSTKGSYHKKNTKWFIDTSTKLHGRRYDYSLVKYQRYHDKVEIVCPTHGSFFQTAGSHIHNKNGCPECGKEKHIGGYGEQRFKNHPEIKERSAILYLVKMHSTTEEFFKIGITQKTVNVRLAKDNKVPYDFDIINIQKGTLYNLFKNEQRIKKVLSEYKYRPQIKFNGHTECFKIIAKNLLLEEIDHVQI